MCSRCQWNSGMLLLLLAVLVNTSLQSTCKENEVCGVRTFPTLTRGCLHKDECMNASHYWTIMKTCNGFYATETGCCCEEVECNKDPAMMTSGASDYRSVAPLIASALAFGVIVL